MTMRKAVPLLIALLLIGGCGQKKKPVPQAEDIGAPQVATSLDDIGLPVDKSDEITSIDAATGDAGGMPRDGGAVIAPPKPASEKPTETDDTPPPSDLPPPLVVPPATPPVIAAPAPVTVPKPN